MADFKKGDVVRLRSGGPRMTIQDLGGGDYTTSTFVIDDPVVCVWFEGPNLQEKVFERACLESFPE